jgi:pimeloyl-[acyl-carrier protein] methyl ester esterase
LAHELLQESVAETDDCEIVSVHALLENGHAELPALQRSLPAGKETYCSAYAASLAARLTASRRPATLVGWSMGGLIALETAIGFPELVCRLVLMSTGATFCATARSPWGVPPAKVRAMLLGLRRDREGTLRRFFTAAYGANPLAQRHCQWAADLKTEDLELGLRYLLTADLSAELPGLHTPTLIVHGRQDQILPWQASDVLQAGIPASRRLLVEGGHGLVVAAPERVLPALRFFLEEVA